MKKVSIIIPVFNGEANLSRCIYSVLYQTYHNLQILLIDDGSQDRSLEICRQFEKLDSRITVLSYGNNRGVSFARNYGLNAADGTYVMFVDCDDEVLPEMVERYADKIEEEAADIVVGGIIIRTEDGAEEPVFPCDRVHTPSSFWAGVCMETRGIYGYVPNKMYDLSFLKKNCVNFDTQRHAQEDLTFALAAYEKAGKIVSFQYSGYIYYRAGERRKVPWHDLLSNMLVVLMNAEKHTVDPKIIKLQADRIHLSLFSALYDASGIEMIRSFYSVNHIERMQKYTASRAEIRLVEYFFWRRKSGLILAYFRLRDYVKRIKRTVGNA